MKVIMRQDARTERLGAAAQPQETRRYYDCDHVRLVITELPDGFEQKTHRHDDLYDITWVIEGEVEVSERDAGGTMRSRVLGEEDLAVLSPGLFHTVSNRSGRFARTLTIKFARPANVSADQFLASLKSDWHGEEE
jgi:redox-sensitive bicupin YhaK (pirin superfamily)